MANALSSVVGNDIYTLSGLSAPQAAVKTVLTTDAPECSFAVKLYDPNSPLSYNFKFGTWAGSGGAGTLDLAPNSQILVRYTGDFSLMNPCLSYKLQLQSK